MALIKCPECGNQISDQAKSCPQCGFVLNNGGNNNKAVNKKGMTIVIIAITTVILLTVAVITIVKLSNPFSGWRTGREGKKIENQTGPGSIDEPYKMGDVINIVAFDGVGYNYGTGQRDVENETHFTISNISIEDSTQYEDCYSVYFDVECTESEKSDPLILNDYFYVGGLSKNGQELSRHLIDKEDHSSGASLVKGGKMRAVEDISKEEGDISKIFFSYYEESGERVNTYIDVK